MKTKIYILITLFFCTAYSCDKNNKNNNDAQLLYCYDETAMTDPWQKAQNDSVLIINVEQYLASNSINVLKVTIVNDGTYETCKAAYCKTGRRIKALINTNDSSEIIKLRFYECK